MVKFIECSDENKTVVGEGYYSKSGEYINIVTSDSSVGNFFKTFCDEGVMVKKLEFKKDIGHISFPYPILVLECDNTLKGEWHIKIKESITKIKK